MKKKGDFISFVRNGVTYNGIIERDYKKGKGYKVRFRKDNPLADSFYQALDVCFTKSVGEFQK